MKTVGAYEAKTNLGRLLEQVEAGERITITKHGRPVAVLVPPGELPSASTAETIAELRRFREAHALGDLTVRELIEEGRRY